jgi:cytochrome c oxidase assembly factor CtaG
MRSEYRFPRSAIFLMMVLLVAVVVAIESARSIAAGETKDISAWAILRVFMFGVGLMCVTGAIGYAILSVLRSTGADRLANIQSWFRQR